MHELSEQETVEKTVLNFEWALYEHGVVLLPREGLDFIAFPLVL